MPEEAEAERVEEAESAEEAELVGPQRLPPPQRLTLGSGGRGCSGGPSVLLSAGVVVCGSGAPSVEGRYTHKVVTVVVVALVGSLLSGGCGGG